MSADASHTPAGFQRTAWVLVLAAAAVHATLVGRAEPLQSANDRSRWCTIWSLVNRGTYQIDEIRQRPTWNTIDLVLVDGHFYSTKPPLMSTWLAGVVWCIERVTGWTLDTDLNRINAVLLLVVNVAPFVLSLWLLARVLAQCGVSDWTAWFVLATASFGTLISPFLTTLNNHTVAAAGMMVAAAAWLGVRTDSPRWKYALWGFSSAWAACHDLPAALAALWMFCVAWRRNRAAALTAFAPAAGLPVAMFVAVNYVATGQWQPMYASYGGAAYRFVHEGIPSYWAQPQGIDRNLDSPPVYLLHCLFGHHGWFSLTPVFLLAGWGLFVSAPPMTGRSGVTGRVLTAVTLGISAVVLGFYLTRTGNYNYGGVSCGLRWALFLTPLWLVTLIPAVESCSRSGWLRGAALLMLAASIYSAWEPMGRAWQQPWLFRWMEAAEWIDYRDRPPELPRPLHSWLAALPDTGDAPFVELQRLAPTGDEERLRVELKGDERIGTRQCAVVEITQRRKDVLLSQRRLRIDRDAFAAGRPPASCLVWVNPQVTAAEQQADLALFRGLPLLQAYRPGFIRYLKTPLRPDALPCQRAAAQVRYPADSRSALIYRCDVWICEELPFGTARVDWTVSDPETAVILQQESWQVVDCAPPVSPHSPVTVDHLPPFRDHSAEQAAP